MFYFQTLTETPRVVVQVVEVVVIVVEMVVVDVVAVVVCSSDGNSGNEQ